MVIGIKGNCKREFAKFEKELDVKLTLALQEVASDLYKETQEAQSPVPCPDSAYGNK